MLALLVVCALAALLAPRVRGAHARPRARSRRASSPRSAPSTTRTPCPCHGASSGRRLPLSPSLLTLPEEVRILPGILPLWLERALLVVGNGRLRQRGQLSRRARLDDGGGGRPHHPCRRRAACLRHRAGWDRPSCARSARRHARLRHIQQASGEHFSWRCRQPADRSLPVADADLCRQGNLAAAVLLPLYMVADTSITLVRRIINKEPFLSAHRSHYYQRAVTGGRSVPEVTARIFLHGLALAMLAIGVALSHSPLFDFVALALGVFSTAATLDWLGARPSVKGTVLVTGASGFIGRSLVGALSPERVMRSRRQRATPKPSPRAPASSAWPCRTSRARSIGRICSQA